MDQTEPVAIRLPSGRSVNACGRIDRIDRVGSGPEFSVCDYKTGSSWKYDKHDPFRQGRVVQHAVYLGIAAPVLQRQVSQQAEV